MSPPIAVAAATAVKFTFSQYRSLVNAQVRFYTDAAGLLPLAVGTGSRDITATNTAEAFEGPFTSPGTAETIVSGINGGTIVGAVDGTWYELDLGGGMQNVTLAAAANVTPGTAVSYRIFVDSPGSSALA
jgi:hypothetical protein